MPIPAEWTTGQAARLLGVSERVVAGRKADGRLPVTASGAIDGAAIVQAGVTALAAQQARPGGADGADDLDANRARESRLRGDKLELINAEIRAELVRADEMEMVIGQAFDAVRGKMLALPSRAAPLVIDCKTALEAQDRLTELVHDALSDLAAADAVSTVKDRTRRRASRNAGGDTDTEEAGAAA